MNKRGTGLMFSRLLQVAGFFSLVLAPLVTSFIDDAILRTTLPNGTTLKDALNILIIASLAGTLLARHCVRGVVNALRWRPYYNRVEHQYFYSADGTVVTRSSYEFINGWARRTAELVPENLVWHREIGAKDLVYRLYYRGSYRDRTLRSARSAITPAGLRGKRRASGDYFFSWTPRIDPPLRRKERIHFMVEIIAANTETAAFAPDGTKLGFGIQLATGQAKVVAHAPFGYHFRLLEPRLTLRDARTLEEIPTPPRHLPRPRISPDGSVLDLTVRRPRPRRRYWVHYRFEKVGNLA